MAGVFLVYRNEGERRYGLEPIAPHPRWVWEYQFILSGAMTASVQERGGTRDVRVIGPAVVVAGPECVHGWSGVPEDRCHAMIFHFDEVDFSIRAIISPTGFRVIRFSAAEVPLLYALYERCAEARRAIGTSPPEAKRRAGFFEPLIYSIVAAELTLLILRHIPRAELAPAPNFGEGKVAEALAWYEANLVRSPTIEDVAHAVHLSATHLRRLFRRIRGISPQQAFTEIQLKRVKWLMRDPALTLERIAENTGFGSASAFSRAFAKEFGIPPNAYRKKGGNTMESGTLRDMKSL